MPHIKISGVTDAIGSAVFVKYISKNTIDGKIVMYLTNPHPGSILS
jgi:hypothetical protein